MPGQHSQRGAGSAQAFTAVTIDGLLEAWVKQGDVVTTAAQMPGNPGADCAGTNNGD